jgi:hypothetical protein
MRRIPVPLKTVLVLFLTFSVGLFVGAWASSSLPSADGAADLAAVEEGVGKITSDTLAETVPQDSALMMRSTNASEDQEAGPEEPVADAIEAQITQALESRFKEIDKNWGRMQAELAALRQQVRALDDRSRAISESSLRAGEAQAAARPRTPLEQREALVRAGVDFGTADAVLQRRSQLELDRLELRDRAQREGWLGNDQYREAMAELNSARVPLRDEIGVDAYDRYLYETGRDNRVSVDSVIAGSAGELNGLLPGDVIESYADQPVLDLGDLREATSHGIRDELVPVAVRRNGDIVEVWLPRGPIGIRVEAARVDPRS